VLVNAGMSCTVGDEARRVPSQRDRRNKAKAAPRDIGNEPIPIASVMQPVAQCRNMDVNVGQLDK